MRIVIPGGSGLIGHELSSQLINNGDEVTILSRNPARVVGMPPGVKVIHWDGKTIGDWAHEMERTDAVVNLTGENLSGESFFPTRWTPERKARLVSSRVDAGRVLSQAIEMAQHRPSVFVQASGIGYYGTTRSQPLTEADGPGDDFFSRLSVDWEASSAPVEALGVRRVITRNGVVLSTRGGALTRLLLPYKLFVGGPMGNGQQVYSWIHIQDEVNAIRFLIQNEQAHGVFNLVAPDPVTNAEFGKTIGRVLKRPHYFPLPGIALKLAFGEVALVVLEGQTVLPNKLMELGYNFKYPTLTEALGDLLK